MLLLSGGPRHIGKRTYWERDGCPAQVSFARQPSGTRGCANSRDELLHPRRTCCVVVHRWSLPHPCRLTNPGAHVISSGILTVRKPAQRNVFTISLVFFVTSYTILLLGMPRWPVPYDEGLMLTAVMRIMAGQVPHRDFYAIYGPANFYVPAALFKMFGQNLLVNRLLGFFVEALTTAVTYAIASRYCRRSISIAAAIVTILWFEGWNRSEE